MGELGFEKPEDEEGGSDDEDSLGDLDDFISKIATMLTSLVEGSEDTEIIGKMCFSLQIGDLKNRMLNVFGNYLDEIGMYPDVDEEDDNKPTSTHSEKCEYNFLGKVSMSKI